MRRILSMTLSAIVGFGCDVNDPRSTLVTTVDTLDGVVHVVNEGDPEHWTLVPLVTVGAEDEGPEAFGRVVSVLLDGAGTIFVADAILKEIKIFDAGGTFAKSIGRAGSGPGEFGTLASMAWIEDHIAVLDWGNARIGVFYTSGGWVRQWRVQPITGELAWLHSTGPNEVYALILRRYEQGLPDIGFVRLTPQGPTDTLIAPKYQQLGPEPVQCDTPDGGLSVFGVPYWPRQITRPAPGIMLSYAVNNTYQIAFLAATDDTVRTVSRNDWTPASITDLEWKEAESEYDDFRERWGSQARCTREDRPRPPGKPAMRSWFFDPAGNMWVEAYDQPGFRWDVFDTDGRLIGTLPAPERDERVQPFVRGDRMALVTRNDLDVQFVTVYRIEAVVGGPPRGPGVGG